MKEIFCVIIITILCTYSWWWESNLLDVCTQVAHNIFEMIWYCCKLSFVTVIWSVLSEWVYNPGLYMNVHWDLCLICYNVILLAIQHLTLILFLIMTCIVLLHLLPKNQEVKPIEVNKWITNFLLFQVDRLSLSGYA